MSDFHSRFIRHPRNQSLGRKISLSQGPCDGTARTQIGPDVAASVALSLPAEAEPLGRLDELHPRRENTYLRLLGGLLLCAVPGFDPKHPYASAKVIIKWLDGQNAPVRVSEQTLADIVKRIQRLSIDPPS